jgi:hypothetical protein
MRVLPSFVVVHLHAHALQRPQLLDLTGSLGLDAAVLLFYGAENASRILSFYRQHVGSGPTYNRLASIVTDSLFTCYVRHLARLMRAQPQPPNVHVYQNMFTPRADPTNGAISECTNGALCHAGDNPVVLGTGNFTSGRGHCSLAFREACC